MQKISRYIEIEIFADDRNILKLKFYLREAGVNDMPTQRVVLPLPTHRGLNTQHF